MNEAVREFRKLSASEVVKQIVGYNEIIAQFNYVKKHYQDIIKCDATDQEINNYGYMIGGLLVNLSNKQMKVGLDVIKTASAGKVLTSKPLAKKVRTEGNIITNKFPNDSPDAGWKVSYLIENGKIKVDNWQGQKKYDFVVTQDGALVIGDKHSYLANNKNVLAVGQLKIYNNGNSRKIRNSSGHYLPTPTETLNFPSIFRSAGVKTKNAWLEGYKWIPDSTGTIVDFYKKYSIKIGE